MQRMRAVWIRVALAVASLCACGHDDGVNGNASGGADGLDSSEGGSVSGCATNLIFGGPLARHPHRARLAAAVT